MMRNFFCSTCTKAFLLVMLGVFAVACSNSNDDEDTPSDGSDNYTSMAVTGGVTNIKTRGATIKGYLNLDQTQQMLTTDFGIEYSTSSSFGYSSNKVEKQGYTGREFSVSLYDLTPGKTYYYRTYIHQLSGLYIYGETKSFKTLGIESEVKVKAGYGSVTIDGLAENYTIYLSQNENGPFEMYKMTDPYSFKIDGLTPGTTYYFYVEEYNTCSAKIKFTTKQLDLSGTSCTAVSKPNMAKYPAISGTITFTIKSNLGSQYKYGVYVEEDEYYYEQVEYATGNNPYTVTCKYQYRRTSNVFISIDSMEFLYKLMEKGDATNDDIKEFNALLDDTLMYGMPKYFKPFVEIEGERIFFGKSIAGGDGYNSSGSGSGKE